MVSRGLDPDEESDLVRALDRLRSSNQALPKSHRDGPKVLSGGVFQHFPAGIGFLVACPAATGHTAFFALGKPLDGRFPDHDRDTLRGLGNVLAGALERAASEAAVRTLNTGLAKKSVALAEALSVAKRTQKDRDRRIFHLQTINELNAELASKDSARDMLDSFLLMSLGSFNASSGCILHLNRKRREVRFVVRGAVMATPTPDVADDLAYRCFDLAGPRSLSPMTASLIPLDTENLDPSIPFEQSVAVFFVIDRESLGLLLLGPLMRGPRLQGAEASLLLTHTDNFMAHLRNALAFETIQDLNQDLERKNQELTTKFEELSACRLEISTLERAGEALKSFIFREADRMDRISPRDLILIPLFAVAIALLFNLTSPNGIPLVPATFHGEPAPRAEAAEARALLDSGQGVVVDARPREFYDQGHIPGAVNIPPALFDIAYMMSMGDAGPDREIVVYGRTISSLYDEETARRLMERDHEKVRILNGGLKAWERAGYALEDGR